MNNRTQRKRHHSIRGKMVLAMLVALIPLIAVVVYLLMAQNDYINAYDEIVSNMTIANSYNLNFKEEMDESLYKIVVQGRTFTPENREGDPANPYVMIEDLRQDFTVLAGIRTDEQSRQWLNTLLRNIDTLQDRVDDIRTGIAENVPYEENMKMLEDDIYILTDLVQDNIQYYIYYQTRSIDRLKSRLSQNISSFQRFSILLFLIFLTVDVILVIIVVRSITNPIHNLVGVTGRIAKGEFEARSSVTTDDELAELSDSVNDMARNLEVMVAQIKEDERKMRSAELRLLQEQINPHFLYNALDTIIWLVEDGKNDEAVDMVVSLSDFFKLVLSKGREYISIREEERHIRSYLEIQQIRYRDILTYEIAIDPAVYDYLILKMTLQPLVENALYHGIKYKRAIGKITISGTLCEDQTIRLTVEDDGVGMEEEKLKRLREEIMRPCKETESGFGMSNVNERIHMNYGWEYGIFIESETGKGTRVTVTIPALLSDGH